MKIKTAIGLTIVIISLSLITGVSLFVYNAIHAYNINKDFKSIQLQFDPYESSSTYQAQNYKATVYGGFIKGIQKNNGGGESLVIRALSPLPVVSVTNGNAGFVSLLIENINTDFYAKNIVGGSDTKFSLTKTAPATLKVDFSADAGKTIRIEPSKPTGTDSSGKYQYIILGDNRDGYETFEQIIQQVNGLKPVFVIDNGDLVFSGKPNQYRLFDKLVSQISTTLCTTLGNHDIRGNGRSVYTKLYGPPYYSFDFADTHFIFLDSSPGWSEKQAISNEQYIWLEKDLAKSQGKRIFVISHIPPQDPRSGVTKNEIPDYVNKVSSGENWVETKLDNYNENKDMEHGFQDPQEAAKFEKLMSTYHVDTVYLSHIHSYFEYTKDGVRYLISGGAGAELLTKNSYYHYMIAKIKDADKITIVELPSPVNSYLKRYAATVKLFVVAFYDENPAAIVFFIIGLILLLLLLIVKIYLKRKKPLDTFWEWLSDTGRYAVKRFRELFFSRNTDKS